MIAESFISWSPSAIPSNLKSLFLSLMSLPVESIMLKKIRCSSLNFDEQGSLSCFLMYEAVVLTKER